MLMKYRSISPRIPSVNKSRREQRKLALADKLPSHIAL